MKSPVPFSKSSLYDETTFYKEFLEDLNKGRKEIIIESPFITTARMNGFRSVFQRKIKEGVEIYVFTRDPNEHEAPMDSQSEAEIQYFEEIGIQTLICYGHHRKLAIIDREILWEGSLNILSQNNSREIMRRTESLDYVKEVVSFLNYKKFI